MRNRNRIAAAAVAMTSIVAVALTGCSSGSSSADGGVGPITFASGKDLTGAMPQLIDMWNKKHPDQKVTFIELSASPDDQRNSFIQDFQAKSGKYDVLWDDVVWTSEFAAHGWLQPLDAAKVGSDAVLPAAVASATYEGKMYGAPFMTNAGLLYYRSDLVKTPPTTWAELEADCKIAKANNTPYGLSAGIWSDKGSRILAVADRLRAGVIWANTFNRFDPSSPFGGYKESGYGREGGRHGLLAYLKGAAA
ncbi:MAG: aldehyde dehydrogenase family protein [Microbacterium sp.]|nr:aldehyde dehydrogenase family protein [Microbacterium sp.]